jgi:alkanesulfonate monooxygenase SsuD/methylene tetrahydromethanopterin reductase-like flavin-dependent oxidoreductase (luciferase family)
MSVELSLYLYPSFDADRAVSRLAMGEMEDVVDAALESGFTGVWLPEHHAASRFFPPLFQLLTWLAAPRPGMFVGTCVALPPLYHPLHFAEAVATLDWLTEGRAIIGVGAGFRVAEFDAFAADRDARFKHTPEIMGYVRRMLEGERVSFEIGPWKAKDASVSMRGGIVPPILYAAAKSSGVRVAARHGDGLLTNPMIGIDAQIALLDEFDALAPKPAAMRPIILDTVLSDEPERAEERAIRTLGAEWSSFKHWRSEVAALDDIARDPAASLAAMRTIAVVGTADDFREAVAALEARGVSHIVMRPTHAGTTRAETLEAIELAGGALTPMSSMEGAS